MDLEALNKLIGTERDSAMLRLTLARLLAERRQPDQALAHARQAVAMNKDYTAAWKLLGQLLTGQGDRDAAIEAYREGIAASQRCGDVQGGKEMRVFLKRLQSLSD